MPEENLRKNSQEYTERKEVLDSFPYEVQIGADNRCNLRCGFCLAEAYREQGRLHLQDRKVERNPLEIFQALSPYMRYWKSLSLTGPGESLLNPRLDHILQLVRAQSSCSITITTNGTLINERLAGVFLEFGVDEISISLDSLSKPVFEELRVHAKFEKVMRAIRVLQMRKMEKRSEFPRVLLTPTFFRRNIRELPAFIDFAQQQGIHAVQASPGQVYRRDWVSESLLHLPDLTRRMAHQAEKRAGRLGVRFINNLRMVYANRGSRLRRWLRRAEQVDFPTDPSQCRKPWSSLYVEPDGEVRPCCYQSPVYGNIYDQKFPDLWNGERARSLRRAMTFGDPPDLCKRCYEFNRHDPEIMISLEVVDSGSES